MGWFGNSFSFSVCVRWIVDVCTHVFVHIQGKQKLMSGGFFNHSLLLFLRCGLSPDLELTNSTGSPRDPALCRPSAGFKDAHHHTWLFTSIVEIWTQVSILALQAFVSPRPLNYTFRPRLTHFQVSSRCTDWHHPQISKVALLISKRPGLRQNTERKCWLSVKLQLGGGRYLYLIPSLWQLLQLHCWIRKGEGAQGKSDPKMWRLFCCTVCMNLWFYVGLSWYNSADCCTRCRN